MDREIGTPAEEANGDDGTAVSRGKSFTWWLAVTGGGAVVVSLISIGIGVLVSRVTQKSLVQSLNEQVSLIEAQEHQRYGGSTLTASELKLRSDGTRSWYFLFVEHTQSRIAIWDVESAQLVRKLEITVRAPTPPKPPRRLYVPGSTTQLTISPYTEQSWREWHREALRVAPSPVSVPLLNGDHALVFTIEGAVTAEPVATDRIAPLVVSWQPEISRYGYYGLPDNLAGWGTKSLPLAVLLHDRSSQITRLNAAAQIDVSPKSRLLFATQLSRRRRLIAVYTFHVSPTQLKACVRPGTDGPWSRPYKYPSAIPRTMAALRKAAQEACHQR